MVAFKAGTNDVVVSLPAPRLATGNYSLSVDLTLPTVCYYDRVEDCLSLSVEPTGNELGVLPLKQEYGYGSILMPMALAAQDISIKGPA